MLRNFRKAVNELLSIMENINPVICVYYADLSVLRYRLKVAVKYPNNYTCILRS